MPNFRSYIPSVLPFSTKQRIASDLSFTGGHPPNFLNSLTPPPNRLGLGPAAGLGFDGDYKTDTVPRMNAAERERLQGLMRPDSIISVGSLSAGMDRGRERSGKRWDRFSVWMVNEG